jgi:SAM-dependent methyltransferase
MIGSWTLPEEIAMRLICPVCLGPLTREAPDQWRCDSNHKFKEIQGVPILRTDLDNNPLVPPQGNSPLRNERIYKSLGIIGKIKRLVGTNYVPYKVLPQEFIRPNDVVLNLGSGMVERLTPKTVNLDYYFFKEVDIVADADCIPFADGTVDVVIAEYMLEHVTNPFRVCEEMTRVLRSGGILYVSYPFIHPYHSFPKDFFRFTYSGMQEMLPGMEVVRQGPLTGPASRWIGATAELISFFGMGTKLSFLLRGLVLAVLFPIKYLDLILNRLPGAQDHSVNLYGVYRKTADMPTDQKTDDVTETE